MKLYLYGNNPNVGQSILYQDVSDHLSFIVYISWHIINTFFFIFLSNCRSPLFGTSAQPFSAVIGTPVWILGTLCFSWMQPLTGRSPIYVLTQTAVAVPHNMSLNY